MCGAGTLQLLSQYAMVESKRCHLWGKDRQHDDQEHDHRADRAKWFRAQKVINLMQPAAEETAFSSPAERAADLKGALSGSHAYRHLTARRFSRLCLPL